jgi:hypothetical protein
MRSVRAARVLGLVAFLLLALATPVAAFDLNGGCTLELASTDASGAPLDTASGSPEGGDGGTEDDPFLVDWNGQVAWEGTTGATVFTNHTWGVSVFNIPTPLQGGDPNAGEETVFTGSTSVSANAPFEFTGLYFVSGQVNGDGGAHCDGSGWFKLTGNPLATIPFWIAVAIALIGLLLIWSSRPTETVPADTAYSAPPPPQPPYEPPPDPGSPPSTPDSPTESYQTPPSTEDRP